MKKIYVNKSKLENGEFIHGMTTRHMGWSYPVYVMTYDELQEMYQSAYRQGVTDSGSTALVSVEEEAWYAGKPLGVDERE